MFHSHAKQLLLCWIHMIDVLEHLNALIEKVATRQCTFIRYGELAKPYSEVKGTIHFNCKNETVYHYKDQENSSNHS